VDLVPIFKTRSIVSAVLAGKRQLTVEHINRLAAFFNLPHELFFEPLKPEPLTGGGPASKNAINSRDGSQWSGGSRNQ
jgi:hypothetical protein